jgi:hypothetical protein
VSEGDLSGAREGHTSESDSGDDDASGLPATLGAWVWVLGTSALWTALVSLDSKREIFDSMGFELPLLSRHVVDLNAWIASSKLLSYPLLMALTLGPIWPHLRGYRSEALTKGHFVGGAAAFALMGLVWYAGQVPIWELEKALSK